MGSILALAGEVGVFSLRAWIWMVLVLCLLVLFCGLLFFFCESVLFYTLYLCRRLLPPDGLGKGSVDVRYLVFYPSSAVLIVNPYRLSHFSPQPLAHLPPLKRVGTDLALFSEAPSQSQTKPVAE